MSVSRRKYFLAPWDGSSCIPDGRSSGNPTMDSLGTIDDAGDEIASTSSPLLK